jgi:hypothetical protein
MFYVIQWQMDEQGVIILDLQREIETNRDEVRMTLILERTDLNLCSVCLCSHGYWRHLTPINYELLTFLCFGQPFLHLYNSLLKALIMHNIYFSGQNVHNFCTDF